MAASETHTYEIGMRTRFRGITTRQGMLFRGAAGWGEWSPFLDYTGMEIVPWLQAAFEAAELGWPDPVRQLIPVNCTIPAVGPDHAHTMTTASGCSTAKVKVAEPGQSLVDDLARVEAVRGALGAGGKVRVDANGGWSVDEAESALRQLDAYDLEYAEQPCRTVEELAELRLLLARRGSSIPIAADESIRRVEDPYRVLRLEAADIAVLKVQPLGGVRACLEIAERIGLPVVVSSALETSIGIRAGLALAAALPELPFACGLNTVPLLTDDVVDAPLVAEQGAIALADVRIDRRRLEASRAASQTRDFWQARLMATSQLLGSAVTGRGAARE